MQHWTLLFVAKEKKLQKPVIISILKHFVNPYHIVLQEYSSETNRTLKRIGLKEIQTNDLCGGTNDWTSEV